MHTHHTEMDTLAMTGSKHTEHCSIDIITGGCSSLLPSHREDHITPNSKKMLPNHTASHQHQVILVSGGLPATRIHTNGMFLF